MSEVPAPYHTTGDPGDETPPRLGYTAAEVEEVAPGEYMPRGGLKPDIRPGETPDQAMARRRRERRERRLAGLDGKAPATEPLVIEDCEMPSSRARRAPMQAVAMRPTEAEMAAAIVEYDRAYRACESYMALPATSAPPPTLWWELCDAKQAAVAILHALAARLPWPGPFAAQERNGEVR